MGYHVVRCYWIPFANFTSSTTGFARYTSYPGRELSIYFCILSLLVISSFFSCHSKITVIQISSRSNRWLNLVYCIFLVALITCHSKKNE